MLMKKKFHSFSTPPLVLCSPCSSFHHLVLPLPCPLFILVLPFLCPHFPCPLFPLSISPCILPFVLSQNYHLFPLVLSIPLSSLHPVLSFDCPYHLVLSLPAFFVLSSLSLILMLSSLFPCPLFALVLSISLSSLSPCLVLILSSLSLSYITLPSLPSGHHFLSSLSLKLIYP